MSTAISTEWVRICQDEDLLTNTGLCALLDGEQVAIYKINPPKNNLGEDNQDLYAISNYDPIGKANVLSRGILGNIGDHLVVASPLYKQHFDLVSGECLEDPEHRVKTYEVRRINDEIQLKKSAQ
ncbi:MAG: nitrite reductase small subunit NirD [Porticoccus sp.]